MGRQRRPYSPGGIFHLTARTLRREHRFTPRLRGRTLEAINPVRAGLCSDPADYPWTTHALYAGTTEPELPGELSPLRVVVDPMVGLPLFATGPERSRAQQHEDYRAFMDWRQEIDRLLADDDEPPDPPAPWRRYSWGPELHPLFHATGEPRYDEGPPNARLATGTSSAGHRRSVDPP